MNLSRVDSGTCEACFRIICRNCNWIAKKEEVALVQKGLLTSCPQCGWKPQEKQLL